MAFFYDKLRSQKIAIYVSIWDWFINYYVITSRERHKSAPYQKNEGPKKLVKKVSENFFSKKSLTLPKKLKGDPLVSTGMVCYAEKGGKPFGSVR